ncbi:target of rapamycin complex 2 subunit AVO2-like [Apium graveolens]|uniref:target of rapamycin complex 2 subunit AVO2-like n=1 Tax=Apium graveolens TaxID=4045 RepID=UPI003D790EFF
MHPLLPLQAAAKEEDREMVVNLINSRERNIEMLNSGYEALLEITDKNYETVLSLSVLENQLDVVERLIAEDPSYQNGSVRKSSDLRRLIYLAADKGYTDMVKLLSRSYEARKDIGHTGQTALHAAIIKRDEATVINLSRDANKCLVNVADNENWTPLHYASYYEFDSILDVVHVGYKAEEHHSMNGTQWIPTPLHVAAKEGHTSTVKKLMELLPADLYVAADSLTGQNILHLAVLGNKKEMIRHILKNCPEEQIDKILNQQDVNGDTPLHLLIRNGFFVPEVIKHEKIDKMIKNKQYWTSFDMLYFKDQITAEQFGCLTSVERTA